MAEHQRTRVLGRTELRNNHHRLLCCSGRTGLPHTQWTRHVHPSFSMKMRGLMPYWSDAGRPTHGRCGIKQDTQSRDRGQATERWWNSTKSRTLTSVQKETPAYGVLQSLKHLKRLCSGLHPEVEWCLPPETRALAGAAQTYLRLTSILHSKKHSLHFYSTVIKNWLQFDDDY